MFNIVAPNNNELALPVEVERIHGPKPRQPSPSIARQPELSPEGEAESHGKQNRGTKERQRRSKKGAILAREKTLTQAQHVAAHSKKMAVGFLLA